ncbi:uncharacterized protein LOC111274228 [Durio zibethinus]|uniref:Uncharacterized protein LOC111274228 n=1 Tax=Durio zibethinus TaxID=66656 RepID=A0A6P5WEV6_DURZI|nr:uncharacterized protein LOC111274228 [Durio zibethinus]
MANKLQRRTTSRRKIHLLRTLTNSKSVKRSSTILNVLLHFYKLKIKLEEIQREYQNLMAIRNEYLTLLKHIQIPKEVKVEKIAEEYVVKVTCSKGGSKLVSILEAFDELGLNVVQARVSCNHIFAMEAIAVAQDQQSTDIKDITQAVLNAVEKQGGDQEMLARKNYQKVFRCRESNPGLLGESQIS